LKDKWRASVEAKRLADEPGVFPLADQHHPASERWRSICAAPILCPGPAPSTRRFGLHPV